MSRRLTALETYFKLSEAMRDAAEAQEWDELLRIGGERSALFENFPIDLAERLASGEQVPARKLIERCQALDAHIRALAEERQKDLRVLLRVAPP